ESLSFSAPPEVRAVLARVGRSEDVALSPDRSRLALVAFSVNRIFVFEVALAREGGIPAIRLTRCAVLESDAFRQPHGCAFLDDDHLLVCNRGANVELIRIPPFDATENVFRVRPIATIRGLGYLRAAVRTPGSVAAYGIGNHTFRALVCNDHWHFVSEHHVAVAPEPAIVNRGIRLQAGLTIPDGINFSPDHKWIAISNHVHGQVLLFDNTPKLGPRSSPSVVLEGIVCPHGLAFDGRGDLYVADSASPYLHVFEQPAGGWQGRVKASRIVRVMDNDMFYAGRYAAREGGIKGLCVDTVAEVLISTHRLAPVEFRDLRQLRERPGDDDPAQLDDLRRLRDADIARRKSTTLTRVWNLPSRLREDAARVRPYLRNRLRRALPKYETLRLRVRNSRSRESLVGREGPVISMTSHSARIPIAYLAIEAIGRGTLKPKRLVLWLSDRESPDRLPDSLRRLEERGLEIRFTSDLGPHTKYYPYVEQTDAFAEPLVTADDDVLYGRSWLEHLFTAYQADPEVIHGYRVRRMRFNPYHFEPYVDWPPAESTEAGCLNFVTAVEGVIFPPAFLKALKTYGTGFRTACPTSDDIWLNYVAHREGFKVAQVKSEWPVYTLVPGTQVDCLFVHNVVRGGNQIQLAQTYAREDLRAFFSAQEETNGQPDQPA
ncbi:MAG TPA: hypothetical protein VMO47_11730, partial [Rhodothermales bacterium]|nr:hypothetical protein [Rhodothermales bacterium]